MIIYFGMTLGNNVELIDYYLTTYSNIVIGLTILIILIFSLRIFLKRKNEASKDI